jgi:hypothetical protein
MKRMDVEAFLKKNESDWEMEDKKNGWRCDGDKHRDDRPRRADNGGFCGPKEVMQNRMD